MGDDGETRKEKEGRRRKAMRGASRAGKREGHREGGSREVPGRHIVCLFVNLINANATATKRGQRRGREGRERGEERPLANNFSEIFMQHCSVSETGRVREGVR